MAELSISDITPVPNTHWVEDNNSDIKPEHQMQELESNCSEISHSPDAQMTETNTIINPNTHTTATDIIPDLKGKMIYRCKKCRQIVASDETIVSHEHGNGESSFGWRKKSVNQNAPECTAIFVEPLKWMAPVEEGYLFNKLYCIGCKSKLGYFSWVGIQCSCGAWVRPAFQIHKSRIDECQL